MFLAGLIIGATGAFCMMALAIRVVNALDRVLRETFG